MRVIDFHTHVFPDELASSAIATLEAEGHGVKASFPGTVDGLLAEMERAGIEMAVTQPVATRPSQVRSINDWAAATASDRIVPFGAMHPDLEDAPAEIERMAGLGIKGFKMHSEYQRFLPDEERLDPVYTTAADAGLIILFHAGLDIGIPTLRGTPEAFARMLDRHPRLRVVLAHMGGFRLWERVREALVGRDVYFDTSYTLGYLAPEEFVDLARAHGMQRVLFGTDGPWTDIADELAAVRASGLSDDELDGVLAGNAEELLGLRT